MKREQQEKYIREQNFEDLFIDQGWDEAHDQPFSLENRDGEVFQIQAKFQKKGFAVCFCDDERILSLNTADRKRLLHKLGKFYYEHLLIAYGKNANGINEQHWMVSIRPQDRPMRMAVVKWHEDQDLQKLWEKLEGLIFPLAEEETLTVIEVINRVRFAFSANADKISKQFYHQFQTELNRFDEFIIGIQNIVGRKEYAALMLNRLMFIYFIQKKKFLNGEPDYLQNRLQQTKKKYGKDQFHKQFYRNFLRRLFHEGLDLPTEERSEEINQLLGRVPYLNGGLFDPHTSEIENNNIDIPDAAFEKLFAFFDRYNWHLDDRPAASGYDINPEVLGYIFEKYINDRAQMGAYYTQEDITGYIAKNTILPLLLRHTRENCKNAFEASGIWRLLREKPEAYIYAAVNHGCNLSDEQIPENIRCGIAVNEPRLAERRKDWNSPAAEEFALPTETWREVIARRRRCAELRQKLTAGEFQNPDDLITHNLDIIRFVRDAIQEYEGADFIAALFRTIAGVRQQWTRGTNEKIKRGISVLDPACGSGAFLFAALNVLEPLYEDCVERMEEFVAQDDEKVKIGKQKKYPLFRKVLEEIEEHQNRRYWIFKTIILENLYGVDIMAEATEIAKLRLFLKLAAEAKYEPDKKNLGLEPLPDIDYNIRCGNSLVGFANMKQFEEVAGEGLDLNGLSAEVREQAKMIQQVNNRFRQAQDRGDSSYVKEKNILATELGNLNNKLNQYLAEDYGCNEDNENHYKQWKKSHQPFHWIADFYGIVEENGGFDVVIGNPPYIATRKIDYTVKNLLTQNASDIYAWFLERGELLLNNTGQTGMIVPLSLGFSKFFETCRNYLFNHYKNNWFSSYGRIPSALFSFDVRIRNTIYIGSKGKDTECAYTTKLHRWFTKSRPILFSTLEYSTFKPSIWHYHIPKLNTSRLIKSFEMIFSDQDILEKSLLSNQSSHQLQFMQAAYNWLTYSTDMPPCYIEKRIVPHTKTGTLYFADNETRDIAMLLANGKLMLIFWFAIGDDFDVTKKTFSEFPISLQKIPPKIKRNLLSIHKNLTQFMPDTVQYKLNAGKNIGNYNLSKCRQITDQSDILFAEYLGIIDVLEDIELYYSQTIKSQ